MLFKLSVSDCVVTNCTRIHEPQCLAPGCQFSCQVLVVFRGKPDASKRVAAHVPMTHINVAEALNDAGFPARRVHSRTEQLAIAQRL